MDAGHSTSSLSTKRLSLPPAMLFEHSCATQAPDGTTFPKEDHTTMTMTFMSSPSLLMTSESVTEGHPDKVCDQIADAILDDIIAHDPGAHLACAVTAPTGLVPVLGRTPPHHSAACAA